MRDFAIAMIWGVLIGTYSSVFVAVGLLSRFDIKRNDDDGRKHQNMNDPKSPKPSDLLVYEPFRIVETLSLLMATAKQFSCFGRIAQRIHYFTASPNAGGTRPKMLMI